MLLGLARQTLALALIVVSGATASAAARQAQTAAIELPSGAERAAFVGGDYDPKADPAPVLNVAMAIARASDRRVLIEVGGKWCGWCRVLDRTI